MRGVDLIIYILNNNLEYTNVEDIFKGLFITVEQYAVKNKTGISTTKTLFELGKLPGVKIGDTIYILDKGDVKNEKNT